MCGLGGRRRGGRSKAQAAVAAVRVMAREASTLPTREALAAEGVALRSTVEYLERWSWRTWSAAQRSLDMAEAALLAVRQETAEGAVMAVEEAAAKRQQEVGGRKQAVKQGKESGNKCAQKNSKKRPAAMAPAGDHKGTRVRCGTVGGGGR